MASIEKATSGWEAMALLAVVTSIGAALPPNRRPIMLSQLELIATDWEREEAAPNLRYTSRKFLRPTLRMLAQSAP